jgi:hypothetical protein
MRTTTITLVATMFVAMNNCVQLQTRATSSLYSSDFDLDGARQAAQVATALLFGDGSSFNRAQEAAIDRFLISLTRLPEPEEEQPITEISIDESSPAGEIRIDGEISRQILAELADPNSGVWLAYAELSALPQQKIAVETNVNGWWDTVKGWFGKKEEAKTAAQLQIINDHINAEIANMLLSHQGGLASNPMF